MIGIIGMSQSSRRPQRGRQGLLHRFCAVVGSLAIVLVTMVSLPWTAPPADASTNDLTIPLGDTAVQIAYVRTVDTVDRVNDTAANGYSYNSYPWEWAYARACTRYTPGSNNYWTDSVHGSSGQYAAVGYGRKTIDGPCPTYFLVEPGVELT